MALLKIFTTTISLLIVCHALIGHAAQEADTCSSIVTAKTGERAALKCRLPSQNVAWIFCPRNSGAYAIANECSLASPAIGKYRLDKTDGGCNLVIDNVTVSHLGTYTCQDMSLTDQGHSVELANTDENLAFHKYTTQSSVYNNWGSNLAVDGNKDGNMNHGSCMQTHSIAPEWWAVDLGPNTPIGRVRITNRADADTHRLQKFFIGLTDVAPSPGNAPKLNESSICKYYAGNPPPGIPLDIYCEPHTQPGRYLFIYTIQAEYLHFCELEAFYN